MKTFPSWILTAVVAPLLLATGCTVLPESQPITLHYLPVPAITTATDKAQTDWTLRVQLPDASDALNGRRLMVASPGHQLRALSGTRWASPPPALWQNHLIAALRADGRIAAISPERDKLHSDRVLSGTLQSFQLEVDNSGQAAVVIRYDATLADTATRRSIASHSVEIRHPVANQHTDTIVEGFGEAADQLAAAITDWLTTL